MKLTLGCKVCLGLIIIFQFASCTKEYESFTPNAINGSIEDFFSIAQAPQTELNIDTRIIDHQVFPVGVQTYIGLTKESFLNHKNEIYLGAVQLKVQPIKGNSSHVLRCFSGLSTDEVFSPVLTIISIFKDSTGHILNINSASPPVIYTASQDYDHLASYYQDLESKVERWFLSSNAAEYGNWNLSGTEEGNILSGYKFKLAKSGKFSIGIRKFKISGMKTTICLNLPTIFNRMNTLAFIIDKKNTLIFKTNYSNEHDFCIDKGILENSELLEVVIFADLGEGAIRYLRTQRAPDRLNLFEYLPKPETYDYVFHDLRENLD